jgi:ABC-type transporter Mla MlaB component
MTRDGDDGQSAKSKIKRGRGLTQTVKRGIEPAAISWTRSGEWLPGEELRTTAVEAAHTNADITLDLADVDHLDSGTLQILLALANDRREKGLCLHLVNASPLLRQWFEYAGAPSYLSAKLPGQP